MHPLIILLLGVFCVSMLITLCGITLCGIISIIGWVLDEIGVEL